MPDPRIQSIIGLKADEYTQNLEAWKRNERRFGAGEDVYQELRPFSYEKGPPPSGEKSATQQKAKGNLGSYSERKERAVWPEFSQLVVEKFVGLVFGQFPEIGFGSLEDADGGWRREALEENADGVGPNARSLFAFYFDAMARAMATKKRWILAEGPAGAPSTVQDEQDGQRPYLVEYSPTQVPYFRFERGVLQAVRIEYTETVLNADGNEVTEEERTVHYVMTRAGFEGFGTGGEIPFERGGWWQFDDDGEVIERDGERMEGDWEKTGGEIPMCLLYYERSGAKKNRRTGITNLGRLEVNWMDLFSALMNHAWEAGSGSTAFTNVNLDQWNTIREAGQMNARWFGVPGSENGGDVGVERVNGGEKPEAIMAALETLMKQVMTVVARELTTSPDASGRSREVQHLKNNVPRLTNMAGNAEEAVQTSLSFIIQRWGFANESASVEWNKQFDLKTVAERVMQVFELFKEVDARAPQLFADLLLRAAESEGLLPEDSEREDLEQEILEAVGLEQRRKQAEVNRVEQSVEADRRYAEQAGGVTGRAEQLANQAEGT